MLVGTIVFYLLSAVPCYLSLFIPEYDTSSKVFMMIFYRGDTFFTSYFPWGSVAYFYVMMIVGFLFVNIVNLQNVRKDPTLDNHMERHSFWATVTIFGPILAITSGMIVLRSKFNEAGYCQNTETQIEFNPFMVAAY